MFSLQELYGSRIKVTLDESYKAETVSYWKTGERKNWFWEIVGTRGTIYPMALDKNTVCVETTARIGKKLVALFGASCQVSRVCDEGFTLIIPLNLVESTFRYIKPKYRKQYTPEQRLAMASRLRKNLDQKALRKPFLPQISEGAH